MTINETINQVQGVFNDIKGALQERGIDTSNLKPTEYAGAIKNAVQNVTVEDINFIPTLIFKYVTDQGIDTKRPDTPVGGNWQISNETGNSKFVAPAGWFADIDDLKAVVVSKDVLYMSYSIFKNDGINQYLKWTTPIKISGSNGTDGKQGEQGAPGNIAGIVQTFYTPIYYGSTVQTSPELPICKYELSNAELKILTPGWDVKISTGEDGIVWWQSIATYKSNSEIVSCSPPVRISATPTDIVEGVNNYYQLTDSLTAPNINSPDWILEPSSGFPAPTIDKRYLWTKTVTNFTHKNTTGPIILVARYQKGLNSIDFDYYCAPNEEILQQLSEDQWFETSGEALIKTETYEGLNENTKYLWCRERFVFDDGVQDHYRIISTFTAAEKAAIIYSAGIFDDRTLYTRTEEQRPYVYYPDGLKLDLEGNLDDNGKEYYYFVLKYSYDDPNKKISLNDGKYLSFSNAYLNGNWEKMESFDAIYSDIGVFKAANVGKFVFDDKYIFSQFGVDKDDKQEYNYTKYLDYSVGINNSEVKRKGVALAIETGQFIPNILLNAITGEAKFGGGTNVLHSDGSFELADGNLQWKDNVLTVEGHVTAESFETKSSELETSISNLDNSLNSRITSASATWADNLSEYQTTTGETINQLNLRLDGAVSNYYKEGIPVTTEAELNELFNDESWYKHIGDTWTNVNDYNNGDGDPNGGKSWRWCEWIEGKTNDSPIHGNDDKKYHWHIITDNDASRALAEAGKAISVASAKTTTFINNDPQGASEGDLWIVPSSYTGGNYIIGKTYVYKDGWKPVTDPSIPDVSDLDAIKRAFKTGSSGFSQGLIFGEALGVFDQKGTDDSSDDEVKAVINGNPQYKDTEGHTILIAAGIPTEGSDLKTRLQEAKVRICDNGHINIGNSIDYNPDTGLISIGDYIKINEDEGSLEVYDVLSTSETPRKISIGNGTSSVFYGDYTERDDGIYPVLQQTVQIKLDDGAGCYGGGVLMAEFYNRADVGENKMKLSHCLQSYNIFDNNTPAITVNSTGKSILNYAGQIWGHRVSTLIVPTDKIVGGGYYSTAESTTNACNNGDVNFSRCPTSNVPQNLFFTKGQSVKFILPDDTVSEAGDYFDLFKTAEGGAITIIAPCNPSNMSYEPGTQVAMYIKNSSLTFSKATSHRWTTAGHYRAIYNGVEWHVLWMG